MKNKIFSLLILTFVLFLKINVDTFNVNTLGIENKSNSSNSSNSSNISNTLNQEVNVKGKVELIGKGKIKNGLVGNFKDGIYQGTGHGRNGNITLEATIKDGYIVDIGVISVKETRGIYASVIDNLFKSIIYNQSTEVEVISGATYSSLGTIEALNEIMGKAKK